MSVYKPSKQCQSWWYEFNFAGQRIRESAKTRSKKVARDAEKARRRELEEGFNGIKRRDRARLFSVAAEEWVALKRPHLAPRSVAIEEQNLKHLNPHLGGKLLGDIAPEDIARYQQARLDEHAAPKTINLEIGTVRRHPSPESPLGEPTAGR